MTTLVFAYGSNMCLGRMKARCPSANPIAIGALPKHALRFHKKSDDKSGKADAFATGEPTDEVWGVIFAIEDDELPALDASEGGYVRDPLEIPFANGAHITALVYRAEEKRRDSSLKPYSWYLRFVIEGARQHRLPPAYISSLSAVTADTDHNPTRDAKNRAVKC
jgi:hypothetical protein